ncbi:MAG: tetratricopeptide repeat protein [Bacteroidia bacterium]|nr:tetratricopeptide repeat protein [Bacteroidia bacterium]
MGIYQLIKQLASPPRVLNHWRVGTLLVILIFVKISYCQNTNLDKSDRPDSLLANNLYHQADSLNEIGKFPVANEYYYAARNIFEEMAADNHIYWQQFINCINKIGWNTAIYLGHPQDAIQIIEENIEIVENYIAPTDPVSIKFYNTYGVALTISGYFEMALHTLHLPLINNHDSVKDSKGFISTYNSIGIVYNMKGNYDKALTYFQHAHGIKIKLYGHDHPSLSATINNIGLVYWKKGDFGFAKDLFEQDIRLTEKYQGQNHPDLAKSYTNLGIVVAEMGDLNSALLNFQLALSIWENNKIDLHPSLAKNYMNQANILADLNKFEKAKTLYDKALNIKLKIFDKSHPTIGASYFEMGLWALNQSYYQQAEDYLRNALAIYTKVKGEPNIARALSALGKMYGIQKEYRKALDYYEKGIRANFKESIGIFPLQKSDLYSCSSQLVLLNSLQDKAMILFKLALAG